MSTASAPQPQHPSNPASAPPTQPLPAGCCRAERQDQGPSGAPRDDVIIFTIGTTLFLFVVGAFRFGADFLDELMGDGLSTGFLGLGGADAAAAALWSLSLYFVSPFQLLLLFLGKIETERPSDWLQNVLGRALGQPVDTVGYQHPPAVRAAALASCAASGVAIAVALEASLGDATWAVSSGIASCMAAGVYELGRPKRLTSDQAIELEEDWQVFGARWWGRGATVVPRQLTSTSARRAVCVAAVAAGRQLPRARDLGGAASRGPSIPRRSEPATACKRLAPARHGLQLVPGLEEDARRVLQERLPAGARAPLHRARYKRRRQRRATVMSRGGAVDCCAV